MQRNCETVNAIVLHWRSWSWMVLWRPTRPFRTNTQIDVLFIIGDWNAKVGSQETPGVTGKFGLGIQNEAGQRLIEFCQENALVIANTLFQQHKRRLYTWTSPDGQHRNQIDYIICSQRWRSSIQSAKTRPGADCGLDHELLIAKFAHYLLINIVQSIFKIKSEFHRKIWAKTLKVIFTRSAASKASILSWKSILSHMEYI